MKLAIVRTLLLLALPTSAVAQTRLDQDEPRARQEASADVDAPIPRIDYRLVMANPERYGPLEYTETIQSLWGRGDRLRAFFWYQVFATRLGVMLEIAAAQPSEDRSEDGTRGELEMPLMLRLAGARPMTWAYSDPEMANAVVMRAMAYESRLPPPPAFAARGLWGSNVGEARKRLSEMAVEQMRSGVLSPETARMRFRAKGQYVGPWRDAGEPLQDDWR
ncbi:MAG: hypothetical protein JSR45_04300 [Proteobacteria bacterium]|nr:hypothetical protein [Pseudomonadota bacterium]